MSVTESTQPPKRPTAVSLAGAAFIARFEGFSPRLYDDAATPPNATIGFGHLVHRGPVTGEEELTEVTRKQALALLRDDCAEAAAAVGRLVTRPLTQAQFDALVSFTYNCGAGALAESTLLEKVNAGDFEAVPDELARWTRAGPGAPLPGLVRRRRAEADLFMHGSYRAPSPP
jgi:lysozyme